MREYDLVVIGSGPAGEKGAAQAAYFGKKVALVEKETRFGGAAANTGTLPSKTLRETALMLSGFRARDLYGVDLSLEREATVQDFLHREREVKGIEQDRIVHNLERHGVDRYRGFARFVDAHTVEVDCAGQTRRLRAKVVLIATGSSPRRPERYPFDDPRVWDSDQILNLDFMPRTMVVVGAGVIGSEYACTFAALGCRVTLVDGRPGYMGFLDPDIAAVLRKRVEALGVELRLGEDVAFCEPGAQVCVQLGSGQRFEPEAVLVAAGRVSNTDGLGLENAGVRTGKRGLIEVDGHFRTNVPHIYAAGDVVGFPALASTAMEQARLAMVHAFDLGYKDEVAPVLPYGLYTIPEVGFVGLTEVEAGDDCVVGTARYGTNARGVIIGDPEGLLKLVFRRSDMKLLGAHVVGEQATELVHIGLMALLAEATHEIFIRACFNYPTLGQLYKYATYDAMGRRARHAALSDAPGAV